jgi:replication factor A1
LADIEVQDGWEDDIEGSAGWQSTVTVLGEADPAMGASDAGSDRSGSDDGGSEGLDAFSGDGADGSASGATAAETNSNDADTTGEQVEFTGTVVQAGDPIILDDGEETVSVESSADVTLGQKVTVRGELRDGTLDAEDVF